MCTINLGEFIYFCNPIKILNVSNSKQNAKREQLLQDVRSGNQAKRKTAIDALQTYGDESIIKPLIEVIQQDTQSEHKDIIEFLSSLKHTPSKVTVMECVLNPQFSTVQQLILSTIWNSPLDYSEYIADFVKLAVAGDMITALECLTIIENLDGPFEEKDILESQLALKDYMENRTNNSQEKATFISEIALIIKDIDRSLDD
jgi:hypothetical protein